MLTGKRINITSTDHRAGEPRPSLALLKTDLLADQVADRLVDAIARQELVSGEKLIETELAEALGVSRVPVREATRILASQGIVVPTPRRGMRVANFDRDWAIQLHDARYAIERLAAHIVADKMKSDSSLAAILRSRVEQIQEAVDNRRDGWHSINKADLSFHNTVYEIAGSPLLCTLWSAISRHVQIMFAIETYRDHAYDRVIAEHHRYIDCLLSADMSAIDKELNSHVAGARIFGNAAET